MARTQKDGSKSQIPSKNVPQEPEICEEEIDLRGYLEVILRRKKLIIGTFLTCTILAAERLLCWLWLTGNGIVSGVTPSNAS